MTSKLIEEYHFLILDLMEIDSTYEWNKILSSENYDYDTALEKIHAILLRIVTSYDKSMLRSDEAEIECYISDLYWLNTIIDRM